MDQAQLNRDHYKRRAAEIRKRGVRPSATPEPVCCCPCHSTPKQREYWAPPGTRNEGMPAYGTPEYYREKGRRMRNGTWITQLEQAAARRAANNGGKNL